MSFPDNFYGTSPRLPNLSTQLKGQSNLDLLKVQRRQVQELIVSIQANPKPTYDIDGQNIEWTEYLDMLYKQLSRLNELINFEEGPIEEESWGYT